MRQQTILRLLLACFLLYFAKDYIPNATLQIERIFWAAWLGFLLLVLGGNLATLLHISRPPVMERNVNNEKKRRKQTSL